MYKIVHLVKNLDIGGTAKTAQIFVRELSKHSDYEVHVIFNSSCSNERLLLFQEIDDLIMHPYDSDQKLKNKIHALNPDLLHLYRSGFPEFPEPGRDINVKNVIETNVFGFIDPSSKIDRSLFMSKWLMDYAMKFRSLPAFQCVDFPDHRFDYVYNPVDHPATSESMRDALRLNAETIVLGRIGRSDNGIYDDISIKAMAELVGNYDFCFLVVAPPPAMIADIDRYKIPHRMITPTIDPIKLSKFFNTLDIYCHARADGETMGCNLAEAMMHGKPCITHVAVPKHEGMGVFQAQTEIVSMGQTGFISSYDYQQYAMLIECLINNNRLREQMGRAGKDKAMRTYSTEVVVAELKSIYRGVLDNG